MEPILKNLRDPDQRRLFDPFDGVIGQTGRKQIEQGWQGLLRHVLLRKLPARQLGKSLSDDLGRPSAELYAMCGLLLVREFNHWTVPETHEAVLFRSDVQYALNLQPGFDISQRTIERYIAVMYDDDSLATEIFAALTDHLVNELEISVRKQRLDSTHVMSDMAVFGRARMMGVAIRRFLRAVYKHSPEVFERVPEPLRKRYMKESDAGVFGNARTSEARQKARSQAAEDLHTIIGLYADHEAISVWKRYQQLVTIFDQQCEVVEDQIEIKPKPGGAIVQNPSDPDATYCGKKGPGYQIQLSETYDEANETNLILSARVETAVESDADAVVPVLEDLAARDQAPDTMLADAGYGGDKNVEWAKSQAIELVSPVPGSAKYDPEKVGYDKFTVDQNEVDEPTVTACPAGHAPECSQYNASSDRVAVTMDHATCTACPLLERCPVKLRRGKRRSTAKVHFEMLEYRAGRRREVEQTEAFRAAYRPRSGIEGTNSCLKRRVGLGRLRIRGRPAVRSVLLLKIAGWNLLRASTTKTLRARVAAIMKKIASLRALGVFQSLIRRTKTLRKLRDAYEVASAS